MRILLLHAVGDPESLRRTTLNHAFCMPKYAPEHDYTLHPLAGDTSILEGREFDAILLDATFLCQRWIRPRTLFDGLLQQYDFVRRSSAVKIAFPQDDYDHAGVLDRWLLDWRVDVIYTPLARFAEVLYPRSLRTAEIVPSLTGYVDAVDCAVLAARAKPFQQRTVDVGYRARELPAQFGRAGQLKSDIGRRFANRLPAGHGLVLDLSTNPADTLLGDSWLDFLGDCRFFLGSASGSSVIDTDGGIKDCVTQFSIRHPGATFSETEASCFPGLDGKHLMTALGPRHLECAVAGTCQILVPDDGLLPFEPGLHYIPMAPDASDMDRVLEEMRDAQRVREYIAAARSLVDSPEFGYPAYVRQIEARIITHRAAARDRSEQTARPAYKDDLAASVAQRPADREALIIRRLLAAELAVQRSDSARLYREVERLSLRTDELGRELVAALQADIEPLSKRADELALELAVARATSTTAQRKADIRMGLRGALREVTGINHYLDYPDGPARLRPMVLVYRALLGWRRHGLIGLLRRVRARLSSLNTSSGDSQEPVRVPLSVPEPGTITMLVPDDRIDRRVLLSARSLQRAGWRVTVIAAPFPEPIDGDRAAFPDVRIVRIDTARVGRRIALPQAVENSVGGTPSIYYYHNAFLLEALRNPAAVYVAHDLPVLPAAALAARALESGLAYDAHELYPEQHHFAPDRKSAYDRAERELVPLAQMVTTVNISIAQEMARRYGITEPSVIWNAPEADSAKLPMNGHDVLRRELGIPGSHRVVLFQGSLSLNRNIEGLVRAMRHLRTRDVVLVVMGPGDEKRAELRGIAAEAGLLDDRVLFAPAVPQNQLLEFTASADAGVIPYPPIDLNSLYCTPNKLFEYIVAGVPILANDLPELRRFVAGNGFGIVRDLSTPEAIAAAIDELLSLDLEIFRKRLWEKQREFIWEVQGSQVVQLYNAAFGSHPASRGGQSIVCAESQA